MRCTRLERNSTLRWATCVFALVTWQTPLWASEDALACVQALTLPSGYSSFDLSLPATVDVHIKLGDGGKAESIAVNSDVKAIKLNLDGYFGEKTRYRDSCKGRTISFTVHYVLLEPPLDFGVAEVRLDPPDQIFVFCHRIKPALDPVRPK